MSNARSTAGFVSRVGFQLVAPLDVRIGPGVVRRPVDGLGGRSPPEHVEQLAPIHGLLLAPLPLVDPRFSVAREVYGQRAHVLEVGHVLAGRLAGVFGRQASVATQIRDEVVAGTTSFAEAASRFSDTNAETGGDLGWVHAEELAGWMGPSVAKLEPGEVSEVIPMSFGCNLLEVVERREFTPVSFKDAQPALYQSLFQQKMEEEYVLWIEKLRKQVYIERRGIYAEATRVGNRSTQ